MNRFGSFFGGIVRDQSGQDLIEYALIVALIALGAVAGLKSFANVLTGIPGALLQKLSQSF